MQHTNTTVFSDVMRCGPVVFDFSEQSTASIFRVEELLFCSKVGNGKLLRNLANDLTRLNGVLPQKVIFIDSP
jgi:hypothetical protein